MGSAAPERAEGPEEEITALRILSLPQCPECPPAKPNYMSQVITWDCNLGHDHSHLYPVPISLR